MPSASLPFSSIPSQSKLFVQYQEAPLSLKRFYPTAVASYADLADRAGEVLAEYKVDRQPLCDSLAGINTRLGAGPETLANIERLRRPDTVAILTGQQAGLFTGPLYSIYKALSAIKAAECLSDRGIQAVPVFWMATEDHDLAEVSNSLVIDNASRLFESRIRSDGSVDGSSVGRVALEGSIVSVIEDLFAALPVTDFSAELHRDLSDAYSSATDLGQAFGRFLTGLLGKFGLVVVDPLDDAIKQLAAPVYTEAIRHSDEMVTALTARSDELAEAGYHAQVLVEDDHFPLFWHSDDGRRMALRRKADGGFQAKGEKTSFCREELLDLAAASPGRFSPGVMLRPVVQDYLFPTLCYFGGGAEIAYFAQNSEVYRILGRPVTPILHRQSFTVVEAKHARTLERYRLEFADLFAGEAAVLPRIIDEFVDKSTAKLFADVEEKINTELNRLDQALSQMDVTLAENLATRRRKILYHIAALRKKYHFRRAETDETINRRLKSLFAALLPHGHLQERTLSIVSFLDRFGSNFIDWVYESIDLDDKGHRVLYL
ncbi:MAG: bacillithiol biosynthesis cysteine-adding enzyme BshC [Pyrinomonadaceae bacterium]